MEDFVYSLVRFVPDRVRGESINLGVLVLAKTGASRAEFLRRFRTRVRSLDPSVDPAVLEGLIETLKDETSPYQSSMSGKAGPLSKERLAILIDSMRNQLRLSEVRPYRAESLQSATNELFADLVSPHHKQPVEPKGMSLRQLRSLIRKTLISWQTEALRIDEDRTQRGKDARHYADFWVQMGEPLAAVIAIPDDPEERDIAWARRDSVPTIANEFSSQTSQFKTVVVFPPNGHYPPKEFVAETETLLRDVEGVIVTHADELPDLRGQIGIGML